MKRFSAISAFIMVFICTVGLLSVNAAELYGFETSAISDNDQERIWENFKIAPLTPDEIEKCNESFVSFDVSDSGKTVIGTEDKNILVIDKNGDIVCGYLFSDSGSYYVKWHNDNILVMIVRGSFIIEITEDGDLVNMVGADTSESDNDSLWTEMNQRNEVSVNDDLYVGRKNMGIFNIISPYSQLVKIDSAGNESVIYDVTAVQTAKGITATVLSIVFISVVIILIIKLNKKNSAEKGNTVGNSKSIEK